ncbi:hypothetical protein LINPERHAP1_LOCUS22296, partial [Linum perenne]
KYWFESVWKGLIIPSNSFIVWLQVQERVTWKVNMVSWGLSVDISCVFCDDGVDCRDHLFWNCEYSEKVLANLMGTSKCRTWEGVLEFVCRKFSGKTDNAIIWRCNWVTAVSTLWRERCSRAHGGLKRTPKDLVGQIKLDIASIAKGRVADSSLQIFDRNCI